MVEVHPAPLGLLYLHTRQPILIILGVTYAQSLNADRKYHLTFLVCAIISNLDKFSETQHRTVAFNSKYMFDVNNSMTLKSLLPVTKNHWKCQQRVKRLWLPMLSVIYRNLVSSLYGLQDIAPSLWKMVTLPYPSSTKCSLVWIP